MDGPAEPGSGGQIAHSPSLAFDQGDGSWGARVYAFVHGERALASARSATIALPDRLEARYGIDISSIERMDTGVFRLQLGNRTSWVARVFPSSRNREAVEEDGRVLQFLADLGYPAEPPADRRPVMVIEGHPVLVTGFVPGPSAGHDPGTLRALGGLLGRLHELPDNGAAPTRMAGALHHWTPPGGGLSDDLASARKWVDEARMRKGTAAAHLYDAMASELDGSDSCEGLPLAFTHPDFQPANAILTAPEAPVMIDWTGAGRGPRAKGVADLLWHAVARHPEGPKLDAVDAVLAGYCEHSRLEAHELARLPAIIAASELVADCFYVSIGLRPPNQIQAAWPGRNHLGEAIGRRAQLAMAKA